MAFWKIADAAQSWGEAPGSIEPQRCGYCGKFLAVVVELNLKIGVEHIDL
jgi:hypothetical protein